MQRLVEEETHVSDCPVVTLGTVVFVVLRQEVSHRGRMTGVPLFSHPLSAEMKHPVFFCELHSSYRDAFISISHGATVAASYASWYLVIQAFLL